MQKDIKNIIQGIKTLKVYDISTTGSITANKITTPLQTQNLVGRYIIVAASNLGNNGTYLITNQINTTSTVFTISSTLTTEPSKAITIQRDIPLETTLNSLITKLSVANPYILTNYDIPTKNDYFLKYELLSETFISQIDSYKIKEDVNSYIRDINDFIFKDPTNYTKLELDVYSVELSSIITKIDTEHQNILDYFERLKRLMTRLKITDLRVNSEEYLDLFNTRSITDQGLIDEYYEYYEINDYDEYVDYKQVLMFEIKI